MNVKLLTIGITCPLAAIIVNFTFMRSFFILTILSLSFVTFSQPNLDSLDKINKRNVNLKGENLTKAVVNTDGFIWLKADIKRDHRFFGYEKANTNSKRLIMFSVLTTDVKDNPFGCTFGSFYETANLDSLRLKYVSSKGSFIKTKLVRIDSGNTVISYIFFERKWFTFERRSS